MSTAEIYLAPPQEKCALFKRFFFALTRLKAGETAIALLCAANVFVLLASYYVLKTVREALILSEAGAAVKSYSAAGQTLLLLIVIPLYGLVASKVSRSKLITWVTLFFISHLAIFYFMGQAGFRIGVALFLWVGIFNVLVIAQFWAFANDLHNSESGKRAFPIIGIGSALGAWVGSWIASSLFRFLDAYQLILIAGGGLLVCVALTCRIEANREESSTTPATPLTGKGGFQLVLSNRYLSLIAMMVLLFNLVNSLGEYMLGQMVVENAKAAVAAGTITTAQMKETVGTFYGEFFSWVNLLALVLQVCVVSKLFKHVGVAGALFVVPLIALGTYGTMAVLPVLGIVKIAKVLENSSDYSIHNTARHALFLPASPQTKYKAKAAIDTFFWRLGDMLQAGLVLIGTTFAFTTRHYAMINVVLVVGWLLVTAGIFCDKGETFGGEPSDV
jgi:AAA family ATP:ADP antiporter